MSAYNKIIWSEGLFLRPQHFQQQSRFIERFLETRCQALRSHSWGCVTLEVERDLLAIGKFGLRRASGVFPDGTPFRMPDDEPLPPPLDIDANVREEIVYLTVPVRQPSSLEVDRAAAQDNVVRHSIREFEIRDTTADGGGTALLEVAPLRTRLMLAHEPLEGHSRIPIARIIERRADQRVALDEAFIPTVLDARSATVLATFMAELQGRLHQRGETLAGQVSGTGRGGAAEIADFLMLQAINRAEPLATHFLSGGLVHPEDFYRFCVCLAGELSTFTSTSKRPVSLPAYVHEQLRESFEPVMEALRRAFDTLLVPLATRIPIETKQYGFSVAAVPDRTLFKSAVFVLGVRADIGAEEVRKRIPAQLKIAPAEKIREHAKLGLSGITLQPVPVAPRQIPYHAGFVYFELDQASELWTQLSSSGSIGMHLAGEFLGLTMELWAIRG